MQRAWCSYYTGFATIVSKVNCSLNASEHTLVIKGAYFEDVQNWNLDWVGFIKKEIRNVTVN